MKEAWAEKGHPFLSGETVTPGTFQCTECGEKLEVTSVTNLPVCPACQNDAWDEA
jgi:Zn finger protein HypA/HybF involved in hydrogenase expression